MGCTRYCSLGLTVLLAGWAGRAGAQTKNPPSQLPVFDVASIKPYGGSNVLMVRIYLNPDGILETGMPMHMIVREAFGVTNDRLLGEPGWVDTQRYDIQAKVAPEDVPRLKELTQQQRWAMLLPVLEDRCRLKFHHETRELSGYVLTVAKGGLKIRPSDHATGLGSGKIPVSAGATIGDKGIALSARGASMKAIARMISLQIGSTVVDETGLAGQYDYVLKFASDESMRAAMLPPGSPPTPDSDGPEASMPSIFTALQEQLGLKLIPKKEAQDVIVIDHIERPSPN